MVNLDLYDRGVLTNVTHHPDKGYLITLVPDGAGEIIAHVDWRVLDQLARQAAELRPTPDTLPGLTPPAPAEVDILERLRTGYAEGAHQ